MDYDGGWAECAVAREDALIALPDDLPFGQAAIIPDAVSTPYAGHRGNGCGTPGAGGRDQVRAASVPTASGSPVWSARPRSSRWSPCPGLGALAFGADLALDPTADGFAEASFLWVC